jgi:pilus assembly protein CpaF
MTTQDFPNLLGPLAPLQADPTIMEIVVDAPDRVYLARNDNAWTLAEAGVKFDSPEAVRSVIDAALALGGVRLGPERTIGEARLPDGSRLVAVIPPTAIDSPYLVIHKANTFPFTWDWLLSIGTLTAEAHALLMKAIDYRLNILVAGNPGSGKDTTANLMAESLPATDRLIVAANAFEMPVEHPRRIHLEAGGPANLSVTQLLDVAAKMRPDWLVVGNLQGPEAMKAIQLMWSGQRVLTTLYASSPEDALSRLEAMCLMANPGLGLGELRAMIAATVKLITYQQNHTLPDYRIRLTRLVEVQGVEHGRYVLQPLFTYNVALGQLEPTSAYAGWAERIRQGITHG